MYVLAILLLFDFQQIASHVKFPLMNESYWITYAGATTSEIVKYQPNSVDVPIIIIIIIIIMLSELALTSLHFIREMNILFFLV